jgi:hypothetical protein
MALQEPPRSPARRSLRGLDWFVFFVADVQTGFGPFVAVYLTAPKWTQIDIGLVLTVGSLVSRWGRCQAVRSSMPPDRNGRLPASPLSRSQSAR